MNPDPRKTLNRHDHPAPALGTRAAKGTILPAPDRRIWEWTFGVFRSSVCSFPFGHQPWRSWRLGGWEFRIGMDSGDFDGPNGFVFAADLLLALGATRRTSTVLMIQTDCAPGSATARGEERSSRSPRAVRWVLRPATPLLPYRNCIASGPQAQACLSQVAGSLDETVLLVDRLDLFVRRVDRIVHGYPLDDDGLQGIRDGVAA